MVLAGRFTLLRPDSDSTKLCPRYFTVKPSTCCGQPVRLGRGRDAEIVLDSSGTQRNMISRMHCSITYNCSDDDAQFFVTDKGSLNGTFVNGRRVMHQQAHSLRDGDLLLFAGGHQIAPGSSLIDAPKFSLNSSEIEAYGIDVVKQVLLERIDSERQFIVFQFSVLDVPDQEPELILSDGNQRQHIFLQGAVASQQASTGQKRLRDSQTSSSQQTSSNPVSSSSQPSALTAPSQSSLSDSSPKKPKLSGPSDDPMADIQALREQLAREKEELEHKRRELEEMQAAKYSQQSQQQQQTQSSSDASEGDGAKSEKAKPKAVAASAGSPSDAEMEIQEEFKCAICADLILNATTLYCSHTFCKGCINQWLKDKKICPSCRTRVTRKPLKNITLENIIEKIAKQLPQEEQEERKKRQQDLLQQEAKELEKLRQMIDKARQTGVKFLQVRELWLEKDKQTFFAGLGKYAGAARQEYCKLTGLTNAFIDSARFDELKQACQNLNVELVQQIKNGRPVTDYDTTRDRLRDFLEGDTSV